MKVKPIASDSMGVRSMATLIETNDCKILIDPSAALGPKRYSLPPSPPELKTLDEIKANISDIAFSSDVFVISHYHYDHYDPNEKFYENKTVFAKSIYDHINKSQTKRGEDFKKTVEKKCGLIYCDDSSHSLGETKIVFSPPFFHGPSQVRLGYVIMTTIYDDDFKVLHASDVQGPVTKEAKDYIIDQKPDLLVMDGPPTLFLGWRFSKENLQNASDNLVEIIKKVGCEVILDHHLLRDLKYKKRFPQPYIEGKEKVKTFAEYLGKENNTLEANRKKIWKKIEGSEQK